MQFLSFTWLLESENERSRPGLGGALHGASGRRRPLSLTLAASGFQFTLWALPGRQHFGEGACAARRPNEAGSDTFFTGGCVAGDGRTLGVGECAVAWRRRWRSGGPGGDLLDRGWWRWSASATKFAEASLGLKYLARSRGRINRQRGDLLLHRVAGSAWNPLALLLALLARTCLLRPFGHMVHGPTPWHIALETGFTIPSWNDLGLVALGAWWAR